MPFASSSFTGTAFQELSAHDAAWSKQSGYTVDGTLGSTGAYAIQVGTGSPAVYRHSGTPASADYSVFCDITKLSDPAAPQMGPLGRMQSGAATFYSVLYTHNENSIRIIKFVAGSATVLGTPYTRTLSTDETVELELRMVGDQISCYVDGVLRVGPVTDTSITTAGKAGIWLFNMRTTADAGALDNFEASDPIVAGFIAGATLGTTIAAGTLQAIASAFVGGATLGDIVAGGTLGLQPGVLTSQPLRTNNGTLLASTALDYVDVYLEASGVFVGRFTGLSTNGAGVFTVTSALITPGTAYKLDFRATGGQRRMPVATAA